MSKGGLQLKYFCLTPTKENAYGAASRKAMLAYADAIHDENLELAWELRRWEMGCRHNISVDHLMARACGEEGCREDANTPAPSEGS